MPEPPSRAGTAVLVVEDDPAVRRMLAAAFQRWGVTGHFADGGTDAIDLCRQHATSIGLALIEVNMPQMDGPTTLDALRAICPELRCWFVGGHGSDYTRQQLIDCGAEGLMLKPFNLKTLQALLESTCSPRGDGNSA
jgi:CheY-like chemotaxis protein